MQAGNMIGDYLLLIVKKSYNRNRNFKGLGEAGEGASKESLDFNAASQIKADFILMLVVFMLS